MLLIAANSPGEITWLKPVARRARELYGIEVEVLLLPCSFGTGHEARVAGAAPGVHRVWSVSEVLRMLVFGSPFPAGTPLLHLGGDLMYTALLSWRWGWRSWSYLWGRRWWDSALRGYFVRNQHGLDSLLARRIASRKIFLVGDLTTDVVRDQVPDPGPVDPNLVTFLPGSREAELTTLVPFFLGVAQGLKGEGFQFQLMASPFIEPDRLADLLTREPHPAVGGVRGRLVEEGERWFLDAPGVRVEVWREGQLRALSRSALACSIPGTKTAEAGVLAVPCVVIVPLNVPELLPSHGLLGLLDWVPGGRKLKGRLILRQKPHLGLLAQPNQLAGEALMPELVDVFTPAGLAEALLSQLRRPEKLAQVRERLREIYAPLGGASERMLERMLNDGNQL
jgi:hypothetical protein